MDYQSNSHKSKEAKKENSKNLQKVVQGSVTSKKKSELNKLTDVFISEDVHNVKSYILMDVLVPTIKKAIVDIVTDGIHMIFFGGSARGKSSGSTNASYVSYRSYSDRRDSRYDEPRQRSGFDYDNFIFSNRGDAEEVLTRLDEAIDRYGHVTVADLYDLVGKTCDFTANKYGWTNLASAKVTRANDGYVIKLPRAMAIG